MTFHPVGVAPVMRHGRSKAILPPADCANTRTPNYFTLKERLDVKAQASSSNGRANWDGSVRGYGKADRPHTTRDTSSTRQPLPTPWDRPPSFVVGSSHDSLSTGSMARTAELVAIDGLPTGAASRILSNPWHDYSDEAIQSSPYFLNQRHRITGVCL